MDYYHISAQELGKGAKLPILKLGDSGEVFYEMAAEMCAAIRANNAAGKPTVFICPVGPVGQYPIFVRLVNREQLSLRNCWFINMDEYLTDDGQWIAEENPLSFRGFMAREVYGKIAPELLMPEEQRVFPDPNDLGRIPALIEELGGVDIAFGGIGITGHLAFNEPQPELTAEQFAQLPTRVLDIHPETRATNCVGDLGGALEVRMDMQQGNYYEVTSGMDGLKNAGDQSAFNTALASASYTDATGSDYLTNLRMYFYIRAFAGVGFDVSVVAFKIGVFGQLNLDMQYKWLNRGYLEESSNISAVGPVSSRTDDVIQGSNLSVSGSTGIIGAADTNFILCRLHRRALPASEAKANCL